MPACPAGYFIYTVKPGDTLWVIAGQNHTTIYDIAAANPGISLSNLRIGQQLCVRGERGYPRNPGDTLSKRERDLSNLLRMLWEQHVLWTRLAILSIVFGLPDSGPVTDRLIKNPKDFKAALEPLYGNTAATRFSDLLTSHLEIAAQLVQAAKAGDNEGASRLEKSWYANADQIAALLGSINPYWSEKQWRDMLYDHLAMTKSEAVQLLKGDYAQSITTYDDIEKEALRMADTMTGGIVRQFPNLFK